MGEATLGPLTYPESPQEYDNFDEYTAALNKVVGGGTWARYNDYRSMDAGAAVTIEKLGHQFQQMKN